VRPGFRRSIVTQIEPAATFWPAEDYHQRYLEKRGIASWAITVKTRPPPGSRPPPKGAGRFAPGGRAALSPASGPGHVPAVRAVA
jgi:hypothetical protein